MKKRLKRKLEKRLALMEFSRMSRRCGVCGAEMVVRDREMTVEEEIFGTFTLRGFHPVCPNGCEDVYTSRLARDERRIIKARAQELLLKNYPPEKYEYVGVEERAKAENRSIDEILAKDEAHFPVFYITKDRKRLYLKKSCEFYRTQIINGWFDISVPEDIEHGVEAQPHAPKVEIIVE